MSCINLITVINTILTTAFDSYRRTIQNTYQRNESKKCTCPLAKCMSTSRTSTSESNLTKSSVASIVSRPSIRVVRSCLRRRAERSPASQFPQWVDLPIEPVHSAGTDNAIFRLGDDMAVRLPRIQNATLQVDKEHLWLPRLTPQLPLAIPAPLVKGIPGEDYPWHWSIYQWLEGENAMWEAAFQAQAWLDRPSGSTGTCHRLTCWSNEAGSAPSSTLGVWAWAIPHATCKSRGISSPPKPGTSCAQRSRSMTRRGRGWALSVGLIALPYYLSTNPVLAGIARRAIDEALADQKHAA